MTPYWQQGGLSIYSGDVCAVLAELPDESVQCVVTSPPYWALRDYGVEGQLGSEPTPESYIKTMVEVFRDVRRVMRKDACFWLNMGDSYVASAKGSDAGWDKSTLTKPRNGERAIQTAQRASLRKGRQFNGLKPKDLCGIPWRLALALQADGWWLRSDIIWHKPNPRPESVTDLHTKSLEYVFLLTLSAS